MESPDVVELRTLQQFSDYAARGGVIVILDDANRSGAKRIGHLQTRQKACPHVDVEHFREKVVLNAGSNGRYWWARNSKVAARDLDAVMCVHSDKLLGRA